MAPVDTLRIKLLKLAAVVTRNTRRIWLYLASRCLSADILRKPWCSCVHRNSTASA